MEAAEGDIIGALGFGRQRPLQLVVTGDADYGPRPEPAPRPGDGGVVAAQVHAVGAAVRGEIHVVIDDQGDAVSPAESRQFLGLAPACRAVAIFIAVLDEARPALDRVLHGGGQSGARQVLRVGDGVQAPDRGLRRHAVCGDGTDRRPNKGDRAWVVPSPGGDRP